MKLALAQTNPVVGDLSGNAQKIVEYAKRARDEGAELVIFPVLCLTGYPPLDLLESGRFIADVQATVGDLARRLPPEMGVIVGAPVRNQDEAGRGLFNAALFLEKGGRRHTVHKRLLPTYDVFDEHRYFEPAGQQSVIFWRGLRLGLHVCEDMWNQPLNETDKQGASTRYRENPIADLADQDVDLFINISASPFSRGHFDNRTALIEQCCRDYGRPFVLVNQVGANTELIFDGDSRVHGADGECLLQAPLFEETLLVWDIDASYPACPPRNAYVENLHDALVLGIRDYFDKTRSFDKTLVGLSGGIDSALTCALAVEALGSERVVGVTMPSVYSSVGSVEDSRLMADELEITFHEISIDPAVESFNTMLEPQFNKTTAGVAEENIQARARGMTLMALSNKFNYLVLSTGNKSEMAVGYSTLYGDMNGGLAVLADVYKTEVYALAHFVNRRARRHVIPESILTKAPSAELRRGQTDQDTLPPYDVLDDILRLYIEDRKEWKEIVETTGSSADLVKKILGWVDNNEYKRRQAPPGLRVSAKAFGIGRRLPIVMRRERKP